MNRANDDHRNQRAELIGLVRAIQIVNADDPLALLPSAVEDDRVRDTADIVARVRLTMAGQVPDRRVAAPEPAVLPRRRTGWLPALALGVLVLALAVFPQQDVLSTLLFALAPAALLVKWTFEAYAGPELERECAVLDQRARSFRVAKQRLDRAAEAVADARALVDSAAAASDPGADLDEVMRRVQSARTALRSLAGLVAGTSRAARTFAHTWFDAPVESCAAFKQASTVVGPDLVRAALAQVLAQLRSLASMDIEVVMPVRRSSRASGDTRPVTVGAEIEAIVHEVAGSQTTLDKELRRLERSFDTVHQVAATHAIRTRVPARLVRAVALTGMNINVSTLSRARRTPARAVFLREARIAPDISLSRIRRATVTMRVAS